jgi:hypothetical protein
MGHLQLIIVVVTLAICVRLAMFRE